MSAVLDRLTDRYPDLAPCRADLEAAVALLAQRFERGGTLFVCGNGGSHADAEHLVGELMKGFTRPRPLPAPLQEALWRDWGEPGERLAARLHGALPALALGANGALGSAVANDQDPELVFAQQLLGLGRPGDALLGISTSGRSANVLQALRVARTRGLFTLGLCGPDAGPLAELCKVCIRAPGGSTTDIQERHLPLYHALCALLEERFFP